MSNVMSFSSSSSVEQSTLDASLHTSTLIAEAARLHAQLMNGELVETPAIRQSLDALNQACQQFIQACKSNDSVELSKYDEDVTMVDAVDASTEAITVLDEDDDSEDDPFSDESDVDELEDADEAVESTADTGFVAFLNSGKQAGDVIPEPQCTTGQSEPDRKVMIVQAYSNYGFNKRFDCASKDSKEQAKGQRIISETLRQGPVIVRNILGFDPSSVQIRHFLLDGYKGNRHFETIKTLGCKHIPLGSKASEYIAAYATFRPTDVIIIGQRGDGACFQSIVEKHKKMQKVVPDCLYHYLTYFDGEQITLPPLTSQMILEAAQGTDDADREAVALLKLIAGQSEARHKLSCAHEFMRAFGGSVKRNDLGLLPVHGTRKLLSGVMTVQNWGTAQTCKELMGEDMFSPGCKAFGCDGVMHNDAELTYHIYSVHYNKENPWKCPVCGELIRTSGTFRAHLAKEVGISDGLCPEVACQILDARGISRRYNQARLANHKARCHRQAGKAKNVADAAELLRISNMINAER